jgi:hypothetical protein
MITGGTPRPSNAQGNQVSPESNVQENKVNFSLAIARSASWQEATGVTATLDPDLNKQRQALSGHPSSSISKTFMTVLDAI